MTKVRNRKKIIIKRKWVAGTWQRSVMKIVSIIADANRKMSEALHEVYVASRNKHE